MNANLRGAEQAQRIVANLPRILRACEQPGPFIQGIYASELRVVWPK